VVPGAKLWAECTAKAGLHRPGQRQDEHGAEHHDQRDDRDDDHRGLPVVGLQQSQYWQYQQPREGIAVNTGYSPLAWAFAMVKPGYAGCWGYCGCWGFGWP
jgi:hypothetical protein